MEIYDHKKIEQKWQTFWEDKGLYEATDLKNPKKFYALIEFPYPSGDGLHVGHIRSNTAMDIISRKRRREGYEVLYPIGWDAFGLPTENYAIKTGIQPAVVTKTNTDTFRRQLKALGFSFDWSREVNTTDPAYYKWTQWIFLQFLKAGLAYKKKMTINWCPKDLIGLANEEVIDGKCERCGTAVEKREKEQWMLAITKYADRLDSDLDSVDFLPQIKTQQRNWIGKSEGAEIEFVLTATGKDFSKKIKVYTTRPDTLFGVTYIVLAPEHELVRELLASVENKKEVEDYIASVKKETDIERTDAKSEKSGVALAGITATNPVNGEKAPVWLADYVLSDYGTGAVMAVPVHDERDWDFAKKYNLPMREVIEAETGVIQENPEFRRSIVAIVRDPSTQKFLSVNWGNLGGSLFIGGGREEKEDIADCAKREILEETGYSNVKLISQTGRIFHNYFAQSKNKARRIEVYAMLFDLVDYTKQVTKLEKDEVGKFKVEWMSADQVESTIKDELHKTAYELLVKKIPYTREGILMNSGKFNGRNSQGVKKEITEAAGGQWVTKFKLRDWVFSRQRYWGEPIPVVHCEKCGIVPLLENDLPLKLPEVQNYKPTETGESPLAAISEWVNTKCPTCGGKARRETDTMPNWAGSSWYYLRYTDPENKKAFAAADKLKYWTPIDWYNGGMEHTTLHLLYSRFWHKFLFDQGFVPTSEPYQKRTSHGLILAKGGEKMSKSKGNVVNPDGIVAAMGADALRLYEMFMGPFDQAIAWDENGIVGCRRFIERVWKLREKIQPVTADAVANPAHDILINKTIKKVS